MSDYKEVTVRLPKIVIDRLEDVTQQCCGAVTAGQVLQVVAIISLRNQGWMTPLPEKADEQGANGSSDEESGL